MFYLHKFVDWLAEANLITPHESRYHNETFYQHVVSVASKASAYADRPLFIAALLHDIGKPATVKFIEGKGYTFYDHQDHIELVGEFLTEDDEDYQQVIDLIKHHMLPFQLKGPEPYKSYAEKVLLNLVQDNDAAFIGRLFALHTLDKESSYDRDIHDLIPGMMDTIYANRFQNM